MRISHRQLSVWFHFSPRRQELECLCVGAKQETNNYCRVYFHIFVTALLIHCDFERLENALEALELYFLLNHKDDVSVVDSDNCWAFLKCLRVDVDTLNCTRSHGSIGLNSFALSKNNKLVLRTWRTLEFLLVNDVLNVAWNQ